MTASFFTIIATLKLHFAICITLGAAIGDVVDKSAMLYVLPVLEMTLPPEYRKWAGPIMTATIKLLAIFAAWTFSAIVSIVHSATRGGQLFSRNLVKFLREMKIFEIPPRYWYATETIGCVTTILGLWFQLSLGARLPLVFHLFVLPFTIMEHLLIWMFALHH